MSDNTNTESYISEFEKRHKKLSKHGAVITNCVLAFKFPNCAGLSHRDKQIGLSAVNYNKLDTLFQHMMDPQKKVLWDDGCAFIKWSSRKF